MSSRALCTLAIAVAASGCARDLLAVDPPPGVAWIALVEASSTGELIEASPLVRFDAAHSLRLRSGAAKAWAIGYTQAEVDALAPATPDLATPLTAPTPSRCDPGLPRPSWIAALLGPAGDASLPALTAPWLATACPDLTTRLDVDIRCSAPRCSAALTQDACTLTLDLRSCGLGSYRARVDHRGALCGLDADRPGCGFAGSSTLAGRATLACAGPSACHAEVFAEPPKPPWNEARVKVVPEAVPREPTGSAGAEIRGFHRRAGWFSDFALLPGRLVVATHDGRYQDGRGCYDPQPTRLRAFDDRSLAPIATATTPPCLDALVPDAGGGFVGFYGTRAAWRVGRFNPDGKLLASRPLELSTTATRSYDLGGAVRVPEAGEIWAAFTWGGSASGYVLVAIDSSNFGQRIVFTRATDDALALAASGDGTVAVAAGGDQAVRLLDVGTGTTRWRAMLHGLVSSRLGQLSYIPAVHQFLLATPAPDPALFPIADQVLPTARPFFATRAFAPIASAPWPERESLALVGLLSQAAGAPRTALLARFDLVTASFLPGVWAPGLSAPTDLKRSGAEVWIGFAWEGRIMRLAP